MSKKKSTAEVLDAANDPDAHIVEVPPASGDVSTPAPADPVSLVEVPPIAETLVTGRQEVHLGDIHESPTNPRKDYGDLSELVESIKRHGVMQPVLVRRRAGEFELVYGHRRFRAATIAGLQTIPAEVRELSDVEVLEVQLVENAKRKDVNALEEAEAYKRLRDEHGLKAEEIAARVGKNKASVYNVLKIGELVDEDLREALRKGEITPSVALEVARLDPKKQEKIAKPLLRGNVDYDYSDGEQETISTPWSVRDLRAYLTDVFSERLDKANFDLVDALLHPEAGACTECPKRTDKRGEPVAIGFPAVPEDQLCSDLDCFRKKQALQVKRVLDDARQAGKRVLSKKEVEQAYEDGDYPGLKHNGPFVKDGAWAAKYSRSWGDLRKAAAKAGHPVEPALARVPKTGEVDEIYEIAEIKKALKAAGIDKKKSAWDPPAKLTPPGAEKKKALSKKEQEERAQTQLAADLLRATIASLKPSPDHDAKLLRLILASSYGPYATALDKPTRQVKSVEDDNFDTLLSCFDYSDVKITAKDIDDLEDSKRVDVFGRVPAKELRKMVLEHALTSFDCETFSFDHRPEEAVKTMTVVAKLFGVDVEAIKRFTEQGIKNAAALDQPAPAKPSKATTAPFKKIASEGRKAVAKIKKAASPKKPKAKKAKK